MLGGAKFGIFSTLVSADNSFFLELLTNCTVLYGTTLKIGFLGEPGTKVLHTG